MTKQENAGLVQQAYNSIKAGNIEAFLELLAEDVQWQLPEMVNVPFAGSWHGREGVRQFFSKTFELQDVVEFEPDEYIAQDDRVVVLGRFTMRIKATGRDFSSNWAHVWTVTHGSVTHFYEFVDTAIVSKAYTAAKNASESA